MAKSSKQSYESQWQKAFEDAEMRPSAQLWKNIESDLNAAENAKFKRRILFYRIATAAAVACVVILGIYTWNDAFIPQSDDEQRVAIQQQKDTNNITSDREREASENLENSEETDRTASLSDTSSTEAIDNNVANSQNEPALAESVEKNENTDRTAAFSDNTLAETTDKEDSKNQNRSAIANNEFPKSSESNKENEVSAQENLTNTNQRQSFTNEVADNETVPGKVEQEERSDEVTVQPVNPAFNEKTWTGNFENRSLIAIVLVQGIDEQMEGDQSLEQPVGEIYPIPVMPKHRNKDFQPVFFAGLNLSTDYFNPNYDADGTRGSAEYALADGLQNSPGYFSPSQQPSPQAATSMPPETVTSSNFGEENKAQLSFSYGVNFGMAIAEHWTIESGLAYSKFNTSSETAAAFQGISADEAYPVSLANNSSASARQFSSVRFEESSLTNTFDFVAVPMKVGYNIRIDRISVIFSTGVAANFLLQNSISDDAGRLNEVTIKPDESNSPFRKVYYSGVLSGGIHYFLTEQYAFSMTPSYNFSLSSLTKSESNFMSLPYSFGINFGIRYQF